MNVNTGTGKSQFCSLAEVSVGTEERKRNKNNIKKTKPVFSTVKFPCIGTVIFTPVLSTVIKSEACFPQGFLDLSL